MATDPNEIQLTEEQRKLLAKRAEETGRPASELLDELLIETKKRPRRVPREGRSFLDAMKECGMVGAMEGPGDLSTNPAHMEGFGKPLGGNDSD